MTESEFLQASEQVLQRIEQALDHCDGDIDYARNEGVLEIEFDDGAKLIVNQHAPNREIWLAHRSGGFHFAWREGQWRNTRSDTELFAELTRLIALHQPGELRF